MAPDINRIKELIIKLNKYTELYDKGTPAISDKEWDDLYFKLNKLEQETGIIYSDSPTQSINFQTVSKLNKVKHDQPPMLSLDKTKDVNVIRSFVKGQDWMGMFKLDGLSCRLVYSNGNLVQASTRGNGIEGEDITHNARVIPSIPKSIPYLDTLIVDGEIICDYNSFKKFEGEYKNPRNFAAGSIRQLSSAEAASRNLSFIAWDLIKGYDDIDFFFWRLEKLDDLGFTTVPRVGDVETIEDAIKSLDSIELDLCGLYPIDGYVFRFQSQKYYESLGSTEHHFRGAIAYKFYDEEYETRLKYITYDVSRNGVLTPVAVFEPIDIDGSTVERASLHNMSIMEEVLGRTPYYGQHIWVIKANMIIPQITKAIKKDYGDIVAAGGCTVGLGGDYGILCPICGGLTEIRTSDAGVNVLYCTNDNCEGKLVQRIDHFCGKKGLDIKGLSRKTIEKLIDWGWISDNISELFNLQSYREEWINKSGFGAASVDKILNAIEGARTNTPLENFISGIGIPLIGKTIAKEIVKYYPTWEEFRNAVGGDWEEFEGFGPEMSNAINSFDYTDADKIAEMLAFKQPKTQNEDLQAATIKNKTFVITGKLSRKRDDIKAEIESLGGKVTGSVSSKTDYLICNDKNSTTGKSADAKRLNIPIINEEDYEKMKKS